MNASEIVFWNSKFQKMPDYYSQDWRFLLKWLFWNEYYISKQNIPRKKRKFKNSLC